jgi:16S rRNA (cytosine967-C5)-methyltransferase
MTHDPARRLALDVLVAVRERGAYANLLLPQLLRDRRLPPRDRAFATELTYGALRAQGSLDVSLNRFIKREVDPIVRDALRLGAYQLWRTRVPARAAVSTTVDLVRTAAPWAAGFSNAIMRRVAEDPEPPAPAYSKDPRGHLSIVHAHPRWIIDAFADALGVGNDPAGLAELGEALEADDTRPLVHLVARRVSRDELLELAGENAEPGRWSSRAVYLAGGDPGEFRAVREGSAAVQDEGSQLVALVLAAVDAPGDRVIDLASGPGGKAALLAAEGLNVVGLELHEPRAKLVASTGVPVVIGDGRQPPFAAGSTDRVLLDAPCSGLGALRRRPEARLQEALLRQALQLVRPGGVVAYATCSPHRRETVEVISRVAEHPPVAFEEIDVRPLLPADMPDLGDGPSVQLWPHRHGTDAMFISLLRRTS